MSAPKTIRGASALIEKWAGLDYCIAGIEAKRNAAIAAANAAADADLAPLLKQREGLEARISAWWGEAGANLTEGKRKSIELAGCEVGTRKSKDVLSVVGDETALVAALGKLDWAKPLTVTTVRLDRRAALMSIDGVYAKKLHQLGLRRIEGEDTFWIKRVAQGGTLTGGAA